MILAKVRAPIDGRRIHDWLPSAGYALDWRPKASTDGDSQARRDARGGAAARRGRRPKACRTRLSESHRALRLEQTAATGWGAQCTPALR